MRRGEATRQMKGIAYLKPRITSKISISSGTYRCQILGGQQIPENLSNKILPSKMLYLKLPIVPETFSNG